MKQTLKKLLSLMLCVVFVVGILPMTAGAETITQYSKGDIIEFGWYPQTKVTDSQILAHLNAVAPAWESWTSYGYYSGTGVLYDGGMTAKDFMRYTDIVVDGVKYRGVKFTNFRPQQTSDVIAEDGLFVQKQNGYDVDTVYWFRYEPLRWRVLDPAAGLVLCETVIDSQAFQNYCLLENVPGTDGVIWGSAEKTHYANNYAESDIRQWLNNDFYTTAFSDVQQGILQTTTLDNKAFSTVFSAYDAASTDDKIFLLSFSDVLNPQYGFSADTDEEDDARCAKNTDYAKCQGVDSFLSSNSGWCLRSAGIDTNTGCRVLHTGTIPAGESSFAGALNDVSFTSCGIRPACKFDLTADILQSSVEAGSAPVHTMTSTVTAPTCTKKGYTTHVCQDCEYTYTDNEVDVNPDNHAGTAEWTTTATTHEKQWSCCKVYAVKSEAHKWTDGVCTDCGYVCKHKDGEATCIEQAVCEICGEHYGELKPDNHTGTAEWTTTATTHEKQWSCCKVYAVESEAHKWTDGVCTDCGYVCAHMGGEATCTEKAVCEICGESYGELNPDNHAGTAEWTTTATTHEKQWSCCKVYAVKSEAHKWENGVCADCGYVCAHAGGEATCTEKAVCEICGERYGETLQHDYTPWTAIILEDETSVEHTHTCTRCGDTQTAPHTFGEWTVETKSTFFEDGEDVRTCTVCRYTEHRMVYSTLHRTFSWLEGFGIFLVAVVLSPFFWIIKTASPALYQQLIHAITGK